MKAAQISTYGDPSVISINQAGIPKPKDGQVLVQVQAASLNPFDTMVRAGYLKDMVPLEFPVTLGGDIAGVIKEAAGDFKVGDKVYGQANAVAGNSGAFAEFAATSTNQVAIAPSNVDATVAAALPLVGVSAIQALEEHLKLQSGQKILIHGGAGAIGSIATQIAKNIGAYVSVTVGTADVDYAKELGADEVIDYSMQNFAELISDYDAVFDTVGGDVLEKSLAVLKPGANAVSMMADVDEATAKAHNVTTVHQMTQVTTLALDRLTELVESNIVSSRIDSTLALDDVAQAFTKRESGQAKGKIVITL